MSARAEQRPADRRLIASLYLRGAVVRRRLGGGVVDEAIDRLAREGILVEEGRRVRLTSLGDKLAYSLAGREDTPLVSLMRDVGEELPAGGSLLDLGCGPGIYLAEAAAGSGMRLVGLDHDAESLGLARAAVSRSGGFVPLVRGDAERLPFASGVFDRVLCVVVLPYVRETPTLREAARVLRAGGRMIVTAHGSGYYLGLVTRRGMTLKRRLFGAVSLAGTFTARAGVRLPGARFQSVRWIERALAPCRMRVVRALRRNGRFGFAEGFRLVLEKEA